MIGYSKDSCFFAGGYIRRPLADVGAAAWALEFTNMATLEPDISETGLIYMRRCGVCGVPLLDGQDCALCLKHSCIREG
jgi:hypothetical protein